MSRRARRRQRGAVAILVAILLPILIGFAALAVDVGHVYFVRSELQNAADAAALAGVQTLDGTVGQQAPARAAAQKYAALHVANGTPVQIGLNSGNASNGDIVLGHWHPEATPPWFEWTADPTVAPSWINAVQVHVQRTAGSGGTVQSFLAQLLGRSSTDVSASSVAVGGGPVSACSFPLVLPDCEVASGGTFKCGQQISLVFKSNQSDNAGLTNLQSGPPVGNSMVRSLIADARAGICHAPSNYVYVQNGNDINPLAGDINSWITANGGPVTVSVPVLQTNQKGGACNVSFNGQFPTAGYTRIQIIRATGAGGKNGNTIDIVVLCNQSENAVAGGGFFGDKATQIYVAK